ncbi:MAG TPA: class I SAM-dependent methyltransferase [Polyangiales bacterium]
MDLEDKVAQHYHHGDLERAILDALRASGKDVEHLRTTELSGADEFHLGWRAATVELAKDLALAAGKRLLDVGSGLGGPARYFAEACGCTVTGLDLSPEYVSVATELTRRCGLASRVSFEQGSALQQPFESASFDVATLIHVGMNIEDKARVFREVRRVLRPGARFGVYEVMHVDASELPYPMPWAATRETSFVASPAVYKQLLADAGFTLEAEHDRRELTLSLWRQMRERAAKEGVPPLSLHTLMGPATPERLGNVMSALERGAIAPVALICRVAS